MSSTEQRPKSKYISFLRWGFLKVYSFFIVTLFPSTLTFFGKLPIPTLAPSDSTEMITYRWPQEGGMRRRWQRWRGSWWRLRRAKKLKVGKSATKVVGRRRWTELLVGARSCTGTLPPRHPAVVLSSPGTSVSSTKLSFVIFLKTNLVGSWSKTARPLFVRFFCVLFCANFKQFWIFLAGGKT